MLTSKNKISYEELGTSDFINSNYIPKLSEIEKDQCEGLISIDECKDILKTFKKNKTPGNDGLTIEFYEYFWEDISELLVNSYNCAFEHGELSTSQKQAIIS